MLNRVWIVSELYYPEETSTGYFLTGIAEGLAKRFRVGVLCSQPTYSRRGLRAPNNEFHNGVRIHRCWSTRFNKDILSLRFVNMLSITLMIFLNGVLRFRSADFVIVVTNPPILPFAVLLASSLRRSQRCLLIHDVYPEVLVGSGIIKRDSALVGSIGWLMQQLYKRMARIIVLGRDMHALVKEKLDGVAQRIQLIPNWADADFVRPCSRFDNPLLAGLGLANKFVIQFSGNIGRTHGIEQLLACAEQLRNEPGIHFLFIGFGGKKLWLQERAKDLNLSNVTIMDYRPRTELSVSLTACDVAIISFVPGMAGVSVPSRMYNVMAAGKPIIAVADGDSELALVVKEEDIGWVIEPGDIAALKIAILEAKTNSDRLAAMGRRARRAAETKYSFEQVRNAYVGLVQSAFQEAGRRIG